MRAERRRRVYPSWLASVAGSPVLNRWFDTMRLRCWAVAVMFVAVGGCNAEPRTPAPLASMLDARPLPDSIKRAMDEAWTRVRARVLDQPPDYLGAITDIVAIGDNSSSQRVTIRLRLSGDYPALSHQLIRIDMRGDGIAWRADRTPLPSDSLRTGDRVRLWMQKVSGVLPVNPPIFPVRALQRLDSLPPRR